MEAIRSVSRSAAIGRVPQARPPDGTEPVAQARPAPQGPPRADIRWALALPVLRVAAVAAACTLTWAIVNAVEPGTAFPPPALLASVAMLPVNLASLWLLRRLLARQGHTVRTSLGFARGRLGRDAAWGPVWIVVLYLPFTGAIMLVAWAQHGADMFEQMETMFVDPAAMPDLTPAIWGVLAVIAVVTFAPLNAPAEELLYRGCAQRGLRASGWRHARLASVVLPSILFGAQHLLYAPTPGAALAFACAFLVWGLGSALIAARQRRLMPLVLAHGMVNLGFSLPALAFLG